MSSSLSTVFLPVETLQLRHQPANIGGTLGCVWGRFLRAAAGGNQSTFFLPIAPCRFANGGRARVKGDRTLERAHVSSALLSVMTLEAELQMANLSYGAVCQATAAVFSPLQLSNRRCFFSSGSAKKKKICQGHRRSAAKRLRQEAFVFFENVFFCFFFPFLHMFLGLVPNQRQK